MSYAHSRIRRSFVPLWVIDLVAPIYWYWYVLPVLIPTAVFCVKCCYSESSDTETEVLEIRAFAQGHKNEIQA